MWLRASEPTLKVNRFYLNTVNAWQHYKSRSYLENKTSTSAILHASETALASKYINVETNIHINLPASDLEHICLISIVIWLKNSRNMLRMLTKSYGIWIDIYIRWLRKFATGNSQVSLAKLMLILRPIMFYLTFPDVRGFAWLKLIQVRLLFNLISRNRAKSAISWNSWCISVAVGIMRVFGLWLMTIYFPPCDNNVLESPNSFKISINCY